MSNAEVLDIMRQVFVLAVRIALPFLIVSMVVGIVIAIFQAATQINEQTLTFVPKLLAILVVLGLRGSSMLNMMQEFVRQLFEIIAGG